MNPEEKYLPEEEIDLMDYLRVILKRKGLILAIFLGSAIFAGIFSYFWPKVYKIDTVLEIGQVAGGIVEEPTQVVEKIEGDVYGIFVREKLGIPQEKYPKIKAENPENTRLVLIEIESNKTQEAKDILNQTIELILKEHQEKFNEKTALLEKEITETEKELEFLKTKKIYADWGIAQLQAQLSQKKKELNDSEMTEVIKSPTISQEPLRPRPLLNMVIAAVLGLFGGVFLAFFQEWWEKSKPKV